MFKKILIANRGEIAVRIIRACREMGIATVVLYQAAELGSLHVRLADESALLDTPQGFLDQDQVLNIAKERAVDAIHPGYGFLAEQVDFVRSCQAAGFTFIGPPIEVIEAAGDKTKALRRAQEHGFSTPLYSDGFFGDKDLNKLRAAAEKIGYPLVVKSCRGGRGRGERLVWSPDRLEKAVQQAQAESQVIYGQRRVYLEKVILPAHQIGVQIVGDGKGGLIHLGEREGSLLYGNQKLIEEAPAPCLSASQRKQLWQAALDLAHLFDFQSVGTVEFLVDEQGQFYFTEIKPRIQIEHPLAELVSSFDLVRQQIRLAAGEALRVKQKDIQLRGWAIQCRINAEDPRRQFLPSPGRLELVRWPGGPGVRVDTYLYCGCDIPAEYDPLIAKLAVWGPDRQTCLERMRSALRECQLVGTATNLSLIQSILDQPGFQEGHYNTEFLLNLEENVPDSERRFRDLAVAAAIVYMQQNQMSRSAPNQRLLSGWHRGSRRLPE